MLLKLGAIKKSPKEDYMKPTKIKSFTLSELLVVMIITAIVVGIAFSVLNLVNKQIRGIEKNFSKNTELSLFEQQLWQDFNLHNKVWYSNNTITFTSDIDTTAYIFNPEYILKNKDTIKIKVDITELYYEGRKVNSGYIDAVNVSGERELPNYFIFVSARMDGAHYMNKNGF